MQQSGSKSSPFLLLKVSAYSLSFLILLTITLFFVVFDTRAIVTPQSELSSQEALLVTHLVKRISKKLASNPSYVDLSIREQELNSLFLLAHNAESRIAATHKIENSQAHFQLSLQLNILSKDYYLNVSSTLLPDEKKIKWEKIRVGALRLPKALGYYFMRFGLSRLTGNDYAKQIIAGVSDINVSQSRISFRFTPSFSFHQGVSQITQRLAQLNGKQLTFNEPRITHYLSFLNQHPSKNNTFALATLLDDLITEVATQVMINNRSAQEENISALISLAVYSEPQVFTHLFNHSLTQDLPKYPPIQLVLAERHDLARHFVISAALKLLTDKGISNGVGQLKEILDSGSGGSGFSFVDISADRAGIFFASLATESTQSAEKVFTYVLQKELSDDDFFPINPKFDEGLSETDFKRKYKSTQSAAYQKLVHEIDHAIKQSHLYNM